LMVSFSMIPIYFTFFAVMFSAVVGCERRSGRGPAAGWRGRSAAWGTGHGGENFVRRDCIRDEEGGEVFGPGGRSGSALVARKARPAIMGTCQNDKQR
jgi:hypothetical protein